MKIVLTSLLMNELKFRFQIPLINKSSFCKWQQKETSSLLHALRAEMSTAIFLAHLDFFDNYYSGLGKTVRFDFRNLISGAQPSSSTGTINM